MIQKNIYPATQAVDEHTHIIKLDVTHEFDDWHLADNARVEFYNANNTGRGIRQWHHPSAATFRRTH